MISVVQRIITPCRRLMHGLRLDLQFRESLHSNLLNVTDNQWIFPIAENRPLNKKDGFGC